MTDRTSLGAGCVYCGVFPLIFYALYATYYMRLREAFPRLALPVFCLAMALVYLGNALLLRRGPALPVLAALNVLLCGGALAAVLALSSLHALGQTFFAAALVIGGCVISVYTAFSPVSVPKLLTECDVTALACAWMCLLEAGGTVTASELLYYPAALLLVLGSLLALRTFGSSRDVVYGSRLQGAVLSLTLLGVIGGALYLFIRFLSGTSRTVAAALIRGVTAGLTALWNLLDRFFTWLAGFWTVEEDPAAVPTQDVMGQGAVTEELAAVELDPRIFIVLGIILTAAVACVLLVLLFRMRHKRLRLEMPELRREKAAGGRRTGALGRRCRELWFRIRFRVVFFFRRDTPAGMLVWLERWGARYDFPRGPGETHRSYLARLGSLPAVEGGEISARLSELADLLDRSYFGPGAEPARFYGGAELRRRFRRNSAQKKENAPSGGQD